MQLNRLQSKGNAMGRLIGLMGGILIGAVLMYAGFHYHVVVTEQKTLFIPKQKAELADVYVDIRQWGVSEWSDHPQLANSLMAAGHGDLVQQSVQQGILDNLFDKIGIRSPIRK